MMSASPACVEAPHDCDHLGRIASYKARLPWERTMSLVIAAALLATPEAAAHLHHERFNHAGAGVEATYRGTLRTDMRQVGAVSAPGRPATLRCRW